MRRRNFLSSLIALPLAGLLPTLIPCEKDSSVVSVSKAEYDRVKANSDRMKFFQLLQEEVEWVNTGHRQSKPEIQLKAA